LADGDPRPFVSRSILSRPREYVFNFVFTDAMPVQMWLAGFRVDVEPNQHRGRIPRNVGVGTACRVLVEPCVIDTACRPAKHLAKAPRALDVVATVGLLGPELVVGAVPDSEVLGFVAAAEAARVDMVELEEGARRATATIGRDVGALEAVALEGFAADGGGYAPGAGRGVRSFRSRAPATT
jgi:hypothetical protein